MVPGGVCILLPKRRVRRAMKIFKIYHPTSYKVLPLVLALHRTYNYMCNIFLYNVIVASPPPYPDSYDVELAPLESIEAWINASRDLTAAVNLNPNIMSEILF